jgi:hypothetical protein
VPKRAAMISALAWVARGVAAESPYKVELSREKVEALLQKANKPTLRNNYNNNFGLHYLFMYFNFFKNLFKTRFQQQFRRGWLSKH